MADESLTPKTNATADKQSHADSKGNDGTPRVDDKSASPGFESADAGTLPAPDTSAAPPSPEDQAARTGKSPSGSSHGSTVMPFASSEPIASPAANVGVPKAPVKKKEETPKPVDASEHSLVKKLRAQFNDAIIEALEFIHQLSIRIERTHIHRVCDFLKRDHATPFDYLSDVTCVHFALRTDAPFELVYNLYSIGANERVRLKVALTETDEVESVTNVWPAANWMEREVFDLFGVRFLNHPDLRRLLLPPDWEGHPLRKDYPLQSMENAWTAKHLPEFTDVQREQLEQRRSHGLEILSSEEERRVRDIFRAGREVMPLNRK